MELGFSLPSVAITRDLDTMEKLLNPLFGYDITRFQPQENAYTIIETEKSNNLPDIYEAGTID